MWSKKFTLRLGHVWLRSADNFAKRYGVRFPDQIIAIHEGVGFGYMNKKQLDRCARAIVDRIEDRSFWEVFEREGAELLSSFLKYTKKMATIPLGDLTNDEIKNLLIEFLNKEDEWMSALWFIFILDEYCTTRLQSHLNTAQRMKKNVSNTYIHAIVGAKKHTLAVQYIVDVKKAALSILKNQTQIEIQVKKLASRYHFLTILNMDEAPLSHKQVRSALTKELSKTQQTLLQEIKDTHLNQKKHVEVYTRLCRKLSKDQRSYRLAQACHALSYYREYRNDIRQQAYAYARPLFVEIARRIGITLSQVLFLSRDELIVSLDKKQASIPTYEIAQRKKHSVAAHIDGKLFHGSPYQNSNSQLPHWHAYRSSSPVKGIGISPGKIQGTAKTIVDVEQDQKKLCEGDILITPTTNLSYVPFLHKVSAVVTDHGDLLSHPAIMCRELQIPCVVGTKNATQQIKDGMYVEVNGSDGTVRILKST